MGARCWGECLLPQRGRENKWLTFLHYWWPTKRPFSSAISNKSPIHCHCSSLYPSSSLPVTLYTFFSINWLLPQSLDLWLILFNHVYNIQVERSSIKGVCWYWVTLFFFFTVNNENSVFTVWPNILQQQYPNKRLNRERIVLWLIWPQPADVCDFSFQLLKRKSALNEAKCQTLFHLWLISSTVSSI